MSGKTESLRIVDPFPDEIAREERIHDQLAEALVLPEKEGKELVDELRRELEDVHRNARSR